MKTILLIDDKSSELARAEQAARKLGFKPIICIPTKDAAGECYFEWMQRIKTADYVVTDLMWRYREDRYEKPMGLLVVIHAKHLGKPIAICTNGGDYDCGHHGDAIGFIYDGYVTSAYNALDKKTAFVWNEDKDWDQAIRDVTGLPLSAETEEKVRRVARGLLPDDQI